MGPSTQRELQTCNRTTTPSPCQTRGSDHRVISVTDHTVYLPVGPQGKLGMRQARWDRRQLCSCSCPQLLSCLRLPDSAAHSETEAQRQALQFSHHSLQVINNSYKDTVRARNSHRKLKKTSQNDITAFSFFLNTSSKHHFCTRLELQLCGLLYV